MRHDSDITKEEDDAAKRFYDAVSFDQSGEKLDCIKESQPEVEENEAEENES